MQYSLKSLFLATAGVAVLFGVACTLPDPLSLSVILYITLILPGATIAMAIYGNGYIRAFAVGCLLSPAGSAFGAIPIFVWVLSFDKSSHLVDIAEAVFRDPPTAKLGIVIFHAMNISCGLLAVAVRWWIQRSKAGRNDAQMRLLSQCSRPTTRSSGETFLVLQSRVRLPANDIRPVRSEEVSAT